MSKFHEHIAVSRGELLAIADQMDATYKELVDMLEQTTGFLRTVIPHEPNAREVYDRACALLSKHHRG